MRTGRIASEQAEPETVQGERSGIQSLVRAFAILETIGRSADGAGLVEVARSVALHSSTAFNLLRTMLTLGYVWQSPDDKRYRIGRPILSLAANAVKELWMVNRARDVLNELSRATGETGHFAAWSGNQVIVLAKSSGSGAFQLADRVGGARPAHATALGKVLLAGLGRARLEQYLQNSASLQRFTARTIVNVKRLRDEIARVECSGIGHDRGEFQDEVRCLAVPVRDFSGQTVGALGLSGPVWRMTDRVIRQLARPLEAAALRLSLELGHGGMSAEFSPAVAAMREGNGEREPSERARTAPRRVSARANPG